MPALTFGVEFEFLIATLPPNIPDPHPVSSKISLPFPSPDNPEDCWEICADTIAEIFTLHGIPTEPHHTSSSHTAGLWYVKADASIDLEPHGRSPYWPGGGGDPYAYLGFEIVSPVLSSEKHGDFDRVKEVGDRGFEIETLDNLMAFLYTFEPGISSLHPPHRRYTEEEKKTAYCVPLRSTVDPTVSKLPGNEFIDFILSRETIEELGMAVTGWSTGKNGQLSLKRTVAYNLVQSISGRHGALKTVEFRQHEGSLDGRGVVLWARFCVALLDFAGRVDRGNLRTYLHKEIETEEETGKFKHISDVCHAIKFDKGKDAWAGVKDDVDVDVSDSSTEVATSPIPEVD